MLTRLTHAAIAFAVTAVLYQAYVLAVAPFIEPAPPTPLVGAAAADGQASHGPEALNKHRELLAAYFPPDHWCFARPPKALESESRQVLAIFDGDRQSPNGVLTLPRVAILFFPTPRDRAAAPPRNAIVLEPSGGAVLQMEPQGQNAAGFGRLQYGQLLGDVIVHSDMNEAGSHDDLRLTTRDIYINEDLIRTDQTVELQLGGHRAFGRELELRWLKSDGGSQSPVGLYGAFDDLVIKHDVSLILAPDKLRFNGTAPRPSGTDAGKQQAADAARPAPPIRIKSAGPFRIDFGGYKATFTDDVRAWQLQSDGTMDELQARELTLYFAKTSRWNDGAPPTSPAAVASGMSFEPASIEAIGEPGKPVVLNAPSFQSTARGERLWIEMAQRRISSVVLGGSEDVSLSHRGSEIYARTLRYVLPAPDSGHRIGTLVASGAGRLLAAVDPARPSDVVEVAWHVQMQIVRRNGQPVVVLDGRPTVSMIGAGKLWADQLQLFLREIPPGDDADASVAPQAAPAGAGGVSSSVVPELITASGRVAIDSPSLTGEVNQLNIKIEQTADAAPGSASGAAAPTASPPPAGGFGGLAPHDGRQRRYDISGIELHADVAMRNRRPAVQGLRVEGGVVFEESPPTPGAPPPVRIVAEQVKVTAADTPHAQIEIAGGGGLNGSPQQLAEVAAHGAVLRAPLLVINRGASQAWINSPGEVQLMVDRDLAGNPLPQPTPLDVAWKESMKLDGRRITFLGDVVVQNSSGWLRTRRLVLQTTHPISFDGAGGSQRPQLEQIECWDGAVAEFQQQDISGVISHQHVEVQSLAVNQVTGAISGEGVGLIDSVHLAQGAGQLLALPQGGGPQPPELVQSSQELRHLHIDFVRGVSGNLHAKSVKVHGDVRTVYGPVSDWTDRLSMTPDGDPGPDEVWITCDTLGVTESPLPRLNNQPTRQVELLAEGKVTIEGQVPKQGAFTAYGQRAKYDQAKGNFILEGDGSVPATIEQQPYPGAPRSPQSAQRILFNHRTGHIKIERLQQGQFNHIQP